MSLALVDLGRVALLNGGDPPEAAKLFGDALTLAKDRGDKRVAAECLQGLGAVSRSAASSAQAARLFGAGDALLEAIGATPTPIEVVDRASSSSPPLQGVRSARSDSPRSGGRAAASRRTRRSSRRSRPPRRGLVATRRRSARRRVVSRLERGWTSARRSARPSGTGTRVSQHPAAPAPRPRARRGGRRADRWARTTTPARSCGRS